MNATVYYEDHASLAGLEGLTVGVIGYGVQGRAFAANLRDSGVQVVVGNVMDDYRNVAVKDGHAVGDIDWAVQQADILLLLIPDEAHKPVFDQDIAPNFKPGSLLCLAHGYSLVAGFIKPVEGLDLTMLGPRLYGTHVRKYFLSGQGVPAFMEILQDYSGKAFDRTIAVAKGMGFTRAGVMELGHKEETFLDLFQEQFLAPAMVALIEMSCKVLSERGYNPYAALMEMYASGEMGKMLIDGAEIGLDKVIDEHASPTCQFGYYKYRDSLLPASMVDKAHEILDDLESGTFAALLNQEANKGYPTVKEASAACAAKALNEIHLHTREIFKFPEDEGAEPYYGPARA